MKMTVSLLPYLCLVVMFLQSCTGYKIAIDTQPKPNTTLVKSSEPYPGWENMPIYFDDERPEAPYELMARIIVTGNQSASEDKLIKKLKYEAATFGADALFFSDKRFVYRTSFDGVSAAINVLSLFTLFTNDPVYSDLEMGSDYDACEVEAIAIKFKKNDG